MFEDDYEGLLQKKLGGPLYKMYRGGHLRKQLADGDWVVPYTATTEEYENPISNWMQGLYSDVTNPSIQKKNSNYSGLSDEDLKHIEIKELEEKLNKLKS